MIAYIKLVKEMVSKVKFKVKVQSNMSKSFQTHTGLQGDNLSCLLFNMALEKAIKTRRTIINRSVQILAYADDIDIIARSKKDLIQTFRALEAEAKKVELQVNIAKTKYIKVSNNNNLVPREDVVRDTYTFEEVKQFIYLGLR